MDPFLVFSSKCIMALRISGIKSRVIRRTESSVSSFFAAEEKSAF
ncbi:hypothetical protein X975_19211, partial [Stegodyphus mimosarum]